MVVSYKEMQKHRKLDEYFEDKDSEGEIESKPIKNKSFKK